METDLETEISDLEDEMAKWKMKYNELKGGKSINRKKKKTAFDFNFDSKETYLETTNNITDNTINESKQEIVDVNVVIENRVEEKQDEKINKKYEMILRDFQYLKKGEMVEFTNQHFLYCQYIGKYCMYGGFRNEYKYLQWMIKPKRGFLVGIENVCSEGEEGEINIKNRYFIIRNMRNREYKILESDYDIFYRLGEPVNHKSKLRKKLEEVTNAKSLRVRRKKTNERVIDLEKEMKKYMEKVKEEGGDDDNDIYEKIEDSTDDESGDER